MTYILLFGVNWKKNIFKWLNFLFTYIDSRYQYETKYWDIGIYIFEFTISASSKMSEIEILLWKSPSALLGLIDSHWLRILKKRIWTRHCRDASFPCQVLDITVFPVFLLHYEMELDRKVILARLYLYSCISSGENVKYYVGKVEHDRKKKFFFFIVLSENLIYISQIK